MTRGTMARHWALAACTVLGACELQEVTVVEFADVAVAEVVVIVASTPSNNRVRAFLHGAGSGGAPSSRTFDDAVVTVTRSDGFVLDFVPGQPDECLGSQPEGATGTCFVGNPALTSSLAAGDELQLDVALGGGGSLFGATRVPGAFQLLGVGSSCRLPPDSRMPVSWTQSERAWAYVNETSINGLPDALTVEGITMDQDPLHLLGLSVSSTDTTVVFPSEFGIFDRFDLDREVAVRLQRGLPQGTTAAVSITAADRNMVNWLRGGNFNPSGAVRVASVVGDGTGVFGATVLREFVVISAAAGGGGTPLCPLS